MRNVKRPNKNINGWEPTWTIGGAEKWGIDARQYLAKIKAIAEEEK